jgi:hypothetical protein
LAETIQGYTQLQARIAALKGPELGKAIMGSLAAAAVREQKLLLYQEVTRRTGHSGQNVILGTVTATSAQTIARSTAAYIETGTRPHEIRPRNKKALFFSPSGAGTRLTGSVKSAFRGSAAARAKVGAVFAMVVHHPGTKPHNFMVQGAQQAISKAGLADRVVAVWNGAGR